MEQNVKAFKAALSAALGVLTALWGWFGWLLVAWIGAMALDVATGMGAALRAGQWSSRVARDGLWHKAGCVSAVTAAGVLDLVAGLLLGSLPADALPFSYTVLLCPLAVVWYLLTEMGSILENAGAMGAPIPGWLRKAIGELRDKLEDRK
ncbi:MAG: phage holin family protein [Oscillospiraceae bacterium]|nr:phage holin family protein [Oscillospiraceae bacterium]